MDRLRRVRVAQVATGLAVERGPAGVAVGELVARAAISRRTFYRLFEGKDAALLAACELQLELVVRRMSAACWRESEPEAQVRAALAELLAIVAEEPEAIQLWLVEGPAGADPSWLARRLAPWVDEACEELGLEPVLPTVRTAEVVAAIMAVLRARVVIGGGDVAELLPALLALAVRPRVSERFTVAAPRVSQSAAERVRTLLEAATVTAGAERRVLLSQVADLVVDAVAYEDTEALEALRDAAVAVTDGPAGASLSESDRVILRSLAAAAEAGLGGGPGRVLGIAGAGGGRRGEVPHQALRCLRFIADNPGCTASEIKAALGYRNLSQVTRLLSGLANRRLIRGRAAGARGRAWRATQAGLDALPD